MSPPKHFIAMIHDLLAGHQLDDFSRATIECAVTSVWQDHGIKTSLRKIAEKLSHENDLRTREMGEVLGAM
jgi:hypothetical protein